MGKKEKKPYSLKINIFQHGSFEGKNGWFFKKAESLPVNIEKVLKEKIEEGDRLDWKSGKGRKKWSGWTHPGCIIGRVHALIEDGKSKKEAFVQIAKERNCSSKTVKDIYHKWLRKEYRDEIIFMDDSTKDSDYHPEYPPEYHVNPEFYKNYVKDLLSRRPEDVKRRLKQVCQICGRETLKEAIIAYIEELEKLLTDDKITLEIKKWMTEKDYIERAKSLLAQME